MPGSMLIYGRNRQGRKACSLVEMSKTGIQTREDKKVREPLLILEDQQFCGFKEIKEAMEQIKSRIV